MNARVALALLLSLGGCASASPERDVTRYASLVGHGRAALERASTEELERLRLVAIDLVGTLAQIPDIEPAGTTLQVRPPETAFGLVVVRALEDAGYGLQRVDADQGRFHVGYGERFARTEAGEIEDFTLNVGHVSLSRAYARRGRGIYPSSLMTVAGIAALPDLYLNETLFREQGDDTSFVSGVEAPTLSTDNGVRTVEVTSRDRRPAARRLTAAKAFAEARRYAHGVRVRAESGTANLRRLDRAVLLFGSSDAMRLGPENKLAIRRMSRRYRDGDVLLVRACHDTDGHDAASRDRAMRVGDELLALGVPSAAIGLSPCVRAGYRRAAGTAPAPVELLHYRPGNGGPAGDG